MMSILNRPFYLSFEEKWSLKESERSSPSTSLSHLSDSLFMSTLSSQASASASASSDSPANLSPDRLTVGQLLDVKDSEEKWREALVYKIHGGSSGHDMISVHYFYGANDTHNLSWFRGRCATFHSRSPRPADNCLFSSFRGPGGFASSSLSDRSELSIGSIVQWQGSKYRVTNCYFMYPDVVCLNVDDLLQ